MIGQKTIFNVTFFLFSLYMVLGNIARFINTSFARYNLSFTEIFLYITCFFSFLFLKKNTRFLLGFGIFTLTVLASNFYGILNYGFNLSPFLYALRLIAMVLSGIVIGEIFFERYKLQWEKVLSVFLKIYICITALGFAIYLFFPSAEELWFFLTKYGIGFRGDPHQRRFFSIYFDPNYYSAIICIPIIFSIILQRQTGKARYHFLSFIFISSLLLAWSRAGIFLFASLSFFMFARFFLMQKKLHIPISSLKMKCIALLFIFLVAVYASQELQYFAMRTFSAASNLSIPRKENFLRGLNMYIENPIFGIGYNYLKNFKEAGTGYNLDSSILLTLVCFGLIPFAMLLLWFIIWTQNGLILFRKIGNTFPLLSKTFHILYFYLIVVLLVNSLTVNILYYHFWLIPIISIFTYFTHFAKAFQKQSYSQLGF